MSRIEISRDGAVRTITLNRPKKRNALDSAMLDSLHAAFTETPAADERVVVLRARGTAFCAGLDLVERMRSMGGRAESPIERVLDAMQHNALPIVTIVQGDAIAGGCELALHCDFVVAAQTARFGMSLAQIGLVPTWFLAKKLGVSKRSVTLVRGITSRDKVVRIDGVTDREVRGRLAR